MKLRKMGRFFLFILCALIVFFVLQGEDVSGAPPDLEASHVVRIENLTFFTVNTTVEFHGHEGRNASELREYYQTTSPEDQQAVIDGLEGSVQTIAHDMVTQLFNGSYAYNIEVNVNLTTLTGNLSADVPVQVYANSSANLNRTSYDLPKTANLEDVIYGTFNMGAIVNLEVRLITPSNAISNYTFFPPDGIAIEEHTTGIHGPDSVSWTIDNTEGLFPLKEEDLRLKSPHPPAAYEEDVRVTLILDRKEFDQTSVHVEIKIYAVEVAKYGNLSRNIVSLDYITADGIRMVENNGLLNWNRKRIYQESIDSSKSEIEKSISEALNLTIALNFSWDNATFTGYEVETMGTEPPIEANMISEDITPQLYAIGEEKFGMNDLKVAKGFLNAGGSAEFAIPPMELDIGITPTAKLILSPNMRLKNFTGSGDEPDPKYQNRYSYTWDPRNEFHGTIYSLKKKEYTGSRIEVDVLVDLKKVKVNYGSLEDSTIEVDITGNLAFYRLETPSQIEETLPDGIYIDHITADILRLAYDTGLVDLNEINEIIEEKTDEIEREMRDAFGENTLLRITLDENTLEGYDADNMGDSPPVRIKGYAHISIPISKGADTNSDFLRSYVLKEFTLEFPLSPINGWNITYTVLLPKGIIVTELSDDLGIARKGTRDGRDYVTVTITDQEDNLTVSIGIT
ncbi:MAG: hypothetical protein KAU14_06885, partial [Thermoplasmata archaeon]|nr:hypothetical protein [Thermoplasmata archaeon]